MRSLILIAAIAMSGCEVPAGTTIESVFSFPHPPKASSLRESTRFSVMSPYIQRIMTSDGVFFAESDGVYRVDYSGKKTLFVAWSHIPTIGHSIPRHDLWNIRIDRLSDESLLLSSRGETDYVTYTDAFYFQHISRTGQPLELIQTRLGTPRSVRQVQSIDSSHALVYGTNGILNFKDKTYIAISQEYPWSESEPQVVGTHIVTTDRGAWPDNAGRASILVYDLDGKLSAKRSLDEVAPVQGISQYSDAHFASSVLPLSSRLAGVWIWREANHYGEHNDKGLTGYYFFAFDLDQIRSTQGLQLGYTQEIPKLGFSDNRFEMTWLGGLSFVWQAKSKITWKDALEFTSINNKKLVMNDLVFKDWQIENSGTSRTDDGSLSLFEYSASQKMSRIQLINPDGAVRLSEVLPLGDPSSWKAVARHQIFGSHILFEIGDQNVVYEIIDSPKQESSL
ncbi:MAG: hypothetical protein ACJ763_11645 [Bdellovibrionia bacterium]